MLLSKFVEIKCGGSNKKYLINLGYIWKMGELITIPVEDLMEKSRAKVSVICDYCLAEGKTKFIDRTFSRLKAGRKSIEKDACYQCRPKKVREISRKRYGVDNPIQVPEFAEKVALKNRTPIQDVINLFEERGYTLLSSEYLRETQELEFICKKHADFGPQKTSFPNVKRGGSCYKCWIENLSLSGRVEGGITKLGSYLRETVNQWKDDSMKSCEHKCVITESKENLVIHHLYPFNKILKETFDELAYPIHEDISRYSAEELIIIKDKLLEIHYRYPLGIVLNRHIHDLFHASYSKIDFTPNDFLEFSLHFHQKKISLKHKPFLNLKYFPFKKGCSSKYHGVIKKGLKWTSNIHFRGSNITIGHFDYEIEAALSYNNKAIELRGTGTTINLITQEDLLELEYLKEKPKFFPFKSNTSSRFTGVTLHTRKDNRRNAYVVRITIPSGKRVIVGEYQTEMEAAYFYNQRAIEVYGKDTTINYLTDEEIIWVEEKIQSDCFFSHREGAETIYSCLTPNRKRWDVGFTHEGNYHFVGTFATDIEAALAYNCYIEKHDLPRKLNKVNDPDEKLIKKINQHFESDPQYFAHKSSSKTIYSCMKLHKGKWTVCFTHLGVNHYVGRYVSDKEAAQAYNDYVQARGLDRKLNLII